MSDKVNTQFLVADLKIEAAKLMQIGKLNQYISRLHIGNDKQRADAYEEYMLASAELLNAYNAKVKLYGLENL